MEIFQSFNQTIMCFSVTEFSKKQNKLSARTIITITIVTELYLADLEWD